MLHDDDQADVACPGEDAGHGSGCAAPGFAEPGSPMEAYQKKYLAKYGKAPESIMDALGYDLAMVVQAAVTKAGKVRSRTKRALDD